MFEETKTHDVNDVTMAWREVGSGPTLLLLHGLWDSHRTWRRVYPLLAEHFRLLIPDLPGHGLSGRPDAPYTLDWFAQTLYNWLDAIGVDNIHICGHSYGGGVAQWMLLNNRERIDRLALVASGGLGRNVPFGLKFISVPVIGSFFGPVFMRLGAPAVMKLAASTFGHIEPEEIERHVQMVRIPGSDRAFRRTVRGVINLKGQYVQTWQRINSLETLPPVAAFWGDKDPVMPLKHGLAARDRIENASLHIYPKCGHYVHLDSSTRFANELIEFLTDPDRPCARLIS